MTNEVPYMTKVLSIQLQIHYHMTNEVPYMTKVLSIQLQIHYHDK